HQPNAFYNTDLEVQLIRRKIRTIILGGISTNLRVEATARLANERAYEQIFVSDVMAARDGDMHEHTVRRVLPTMGRVRAMDVALDARSSGKPEKGNGLAFSRRTNRFPRGQVPERGTPSGIPTFPHSRIPSNAN